MKKLEEGKWIIDLDKFFLERSNDTSWVGCAADIANVDEIIWEFEYRSGGKNLTVIEYFKKEEMEYHSQKINEFYLHAWWAHLFGFGDWFLTHKQILKEWMGQEKWKI